MEAPLTEQESAALNAVNCMCWDMHVSLLVNDYFFVLKLKSTEGLILHKCPA